MDDAFGWNTQQQQPPSAASCCPSDADDDVILAAFLRGAGATFGNAGVRGGAAAITSDAAYDFTSSCPDDDLRRLLICRGSVSPLPFAGDDPSKSAFLENSAGSLRAPAPAIGARDDSFAFFPKAGEAFSGYSTATGNISSGESNTYDADVASPPCIDIVPPPPAKRRLPETRTTSASGQQHEYEPGMEAMARVKETIYRAAAAAASASFPPAAEADPPPLGPRRRRRNVRISSEPQTVAARLRREKVSERLRALRRLVPGCGSGKMDTASMLHQAACYLRFLKAQLARFQAMAADGDGDGRYSSPSSSMQRHVGRPPWNDNNPPESLGGGNIGNGGAVLAFRRDDGVAARHVMKSNNRNVQSL